jgi:hypothetical protein
MNCPFCSYELKRDVLVCSNCRNDITSYSFYKSRASELIELAKEKIEEKSNSTELLELSLVLDSSNSYPLKLLGLIYADIGYYDKSLYYFGEYNIIEADDSYSGKFIDLIKVWKKDLDRYLSVSF